MDAASTQRSQQGTWEMALLVGMGVSTVPAAICKFMLFGQPTLYQLLLRQMLAY